MLQFGLASFLFCSLSKYIHRTIMLAVSIRVLNLVSYSEVNTRRTEGQRKMVFFLRKLNPNDSKRLKSVNTGYR